MDAKSSFPRSACHAGDTGVVLEARLRHDEGSWEGWSQGNARAFVIPAKRHLELLQMGLSWSVWPIRYRARQILAGLLEKQKGNASGLRRSVWPGLASERGGLRGPERIDNLGALGPDDARGTKEFYAYLIRLAPHDLAIRLEAIDGDDQLERVGDAHHVVDAQARARGGQVPHRARHGQVAIVGRGNAGLQDFPARGHACVVVHRPFEGSVSIHLKRNDRTTGPGQSSQRSPLQSSPFQSLSNW
jgi:hypothetical protein